MVTVIFQSAVSRPKLHHSKGFLHTGINVKQKFAKIVLSVKDFATGIPSQDQSKLFELYSLARGWDQQEDYERFLTY